MIGSTEWGEANADWLRENLCALHQRRRRRVRHANFRASGHARARGLPWRRALERQSRDPSAARATSAVRQDAARSVARRRRIEAAAPRSAGIGLGLRRVPASPDSLPVIDIGFGGNSRRSVPHQRFDDFPMIVERYLDPGFVGHETAGHCCSRSSRQELAASWIPDRSNDAFAADELERHAREACGVARERNAPRSSRPPSRRPAARGKQAVAPGSARAEEREFQSTRPSVRSVTWPKFLAGSRPPRATSDERAARRRVRPDPQRLYACTARHTDGPAAAPVVQEPLVVARARARATARRRSRLRCAAAAKGATGRRASSIRELSDAARCAIERVALRLEWDQRRERPALGRQFLWIVLWSSTSASCASRVTRPSLVFGFVCHPAAQPGGRPTITVLIGDAINRLRGRAGG